MTIINKKGVNYALDHSSTNNTKLSSDIGAVGHSE